MIYVVVLVVASWWKENGRFAQVAEDHYQRIALSTKPLNLNLLSRRIFQLPWPHRRQLALLRRKG